MNAKVMRADRTVCEMPYVFLFDHGANLGYVEAEDGMWVPKCDLEQYNAGRRKPVLPVSELVRSAAEKLKSINVNSSDLISFSLDYEGKIAIHLDSIAISIQAVNALQSGVDIEIAGSSINEKKHVEFTRDGVLFVGFVPASTVDEWQLSEWQLSESCVSVGKIC